MLTPTLTTGLAVQVLTETDVPTQVRRIRALAVRARTYPSTVTAPEARLLTDLARIRLSDPPTPGLPVTTIPALVAVVGREHPDLDDLTVHARARDLAHHALRARADALAATLTRSIR